MQATLQTSGKPPLPKGYSPSHILTKRKCGYKFLLAYIFKATGKKTHPLIYGSDIHSDIAHGIFKSEDQTTQKMLMVAQNFLSKMPGNPIFETTFEDKNNPGKFYGTIFNQHFMCIFDVHWIKALQGVDWKASEHKETYEGDWEIQAYISNELFKQNYDHGLEKFTFVCLKDGYEYEAKSIYPGPVRTRTEKKIKNALDSIQRYEFEKKVSWACQWCEYQGMCI
jgi:hypothetical protein